MSAVAELRRNRELTESLTTSTLTHSRPRSSKAPTRAPFIPAIAFVVAFMMAAGTERSDRRYTVGRPTNQRARHGDQTDVTQSLIGALPFFHHRGTYRPVLDCMEPRGRFLWIRRNSTLYSTIFHTTYFPVGLSWCRKVME